MATGSVSANWSSLILHGVHPTENEIGVGAYGRVFEVDYEGTLCAAKELHALLLKYAKGNELHKIKDDFLNECQIWSTLRHPCVVQFLGVYYPAMDRYKLPVMVMEKMQHSLRGLVEKYDNIPLNVKLSILDEVCLGLRYLHSRNPPIVHRDLTPNNILLSYRLEAKITDVGVAKVVKSDNQKTMTKLPGTPGFMPPEALSIRPVYGPSLDVFSYGAIILNVTTQLWPQPTDLVEFNPDTGRREVVSEVKRRQEYLDEMTGGATDLKPLVISCLNDNPKNRPPVAEVSMTIKRIKDVYSQKSRMSPIVWWAEVSNDQKSQVTSSLTTALEEMTISNEQLKKENDAIKNENNQLKTEIQQLKQQLVLKESTAPNGLFSGPVNIKWEEGAPAPIGSFRHTAVWLNELVYVGGGVESRYNRSFTINCYDLNSNSWKSPIHTSCCNFSMTELNNNLLIAGGVDKSYMKTNQILTMDAGDAGQLENYTKMITARSDATATGYRGMLIITGGEDDEGKILSSTELFDSTNGQWYVSNDLPQPRLTLKSVIVDNILYLLGGFDKDDFASPSVFTASLDTVSIHQLKWSTHQDTPWYRSTPVSVRGTDLLLLGGRNGLYKTTSDVYKLNKAHHSWEAIGHIPSARDGSAAVSTVDNRIIVIGGWNDRSGVTNTVWIGSCEPQ